MLFAAGPDWLGSPQHVVAGAVLSLAVAVAALRFGAPRWLAATIAIGVTSTAEIVLKLAEYVVIRPATHASAYYDSLVDNVSTLVGAIIGAVVGAYVISASGRRR